MLLVTFDLQMQMPRIARVITAHRNHFPPTSISMACCQFNFTDWTRSIQPFVSFKENGRKRQRIFRPLERNKSPNSDSFSIHSRSALKGFRVRNVAKEIFHCNLTKLCMRIWLRMLNQLEIDEMDGGDRMKKYNPICIVLTCSRHTILNNFTYFGSLAVKRKCDKSWSNRMD